MSRKRKLVSDEDETETQPPPHRIFNNVYCLRPIIEQLDTHDKFKLRPVCSGWNYELESMLGLSPTLKLNLISSYPDRTDKHRWSPAQSWQSVLFGCNWTKPETEQDKKAQLTVLDRNFNADFVDELAHIYRKVDTLVVYFDCNEDPRVFANFLRMIKLFKQLASFSLIRAEKLYDFNFIPNIIRTLDDMDSPLTRLDLYVENHFGLGRTPTRAMTLPNSLPYLQHLALPFMMKRNDHQEILSNVGAGLESCRQKGRPEMLTSMCIPMRSYDVATNTRNGLDVAQMFAVNPEMRNIRRLQFTRVRNKFASVGRTRQLCPELEALHLFDCKDIDTNDFIAMINQYEHLTDVALFGKCLPPFEEGYNAPRIRKLAIGGNGWFEQFKFLIEEEDDAERERQVQLAMQNGEVPPPVQAIPWTDRVVNEFVKLINLKFPALEELTVLTDEHPKRYSEIVCQYIESEIAEHFVEAGTLRVVNIKIRRSITEDRI